MVKKKRIKRMLSCESFSFGQKNSSKSLAKYLIESKDVDLLPEVEENNELMKAMEFESDEEEQKQPMS